MIAMTVQNLGTRCKLAVDHPVGENFLEEMTHKISSS
jgi:hypothetical protein